MSVKIETEITFGNEYVDKITGFTGKATGVVRHQFGCVRICLQPKVKDDGTLIESQWFDEASLEAIRPKTKNPGGPMPRPKMTPDPKWSGS